LALALPINNYAQQLQLGLKAGFNFGSIEGRTSDDFYGLINVHGGVYAAQDFNETIGIQVEALLSTLSTVVYNQIYTPQPYLNPQHATLSYLSFPVLLRFKTGSKLVLHAGGQYSMLFGKNKRLTNTDTDAFKHGNISLVFGVQVGLGKRLQLHARYNPGLSSTGHDANGGYYNNRGKTSSVVQLGLGYALFTRTSERK